MKILVICFIGIHSLLIGQEVHSKDEPQALHELQPPKPSEEFRWVHGHWNKKGRDEWQWESGYWHKIGANSSENEQRGNPKAQEGKREQSSVK